MTVPTDGVARGESDEFHDPTPSVRQCVYCVGQGRILERYDRFGPYMWVVCRWCKGKKLMP